MGFTQVTLDHNTTWYHSRWVKMAPSYQGKGFLKRKKLQACRTRIGISGLVEYTAFEFLIGACGNFKQWLSAEKNFKTTVKQIPTRMFETGRCFWEILVDYFDQGCYCLLGKFMTFLACICPRQVNFCLNWSLETFCRIQKKEIY